MNAIPLRDALLAIGIALVAAVLFSLRQGVAAEDWRAAVTVGWFAIPVALAVTVIVLLPLLALLRRCQRFHPLEYMLYPAMAVLCLSMVPLLFLSPGVYENLSEGGKRFISEGRLVWENIGWMLLFNSEPALWAALAGLCFWKLDCRTTRPT